MNLEELKEEIRNKQVELCVATVACAVAFVSANGIALAGFCVFFASIASISLGRKDWSSGRKAAGICSYVFAFGLFIVAYSGVKILENCTDDPNTAAVTSDCQSNQLAASKSIRSTTGIAFLWYVLNPLLFVGGSKRLRKEGAFVDQQGLEIEDLKPNRWFLKEKGFEQFVLKALENASIGERQRYEWVCDIRGITPETHEIGFHYDWEASRLLADAPWYSVYELVEQCVPAIGFLHREHFVTRVNEYLREAQIGWKFEDGTWIRVGDEIGQESHTAAHSACIVLGIEDAAKDLENAWRLCNRPGGGFEKDAVTAAMRALERVAQNITQQDGITLNRIKWKEPDMPHEKLRGAINSLYSYSSDQARHANENATISANDAHLVVSIAGALILYLAEV